MRAGTVFLTFVSSLLLLQAVALAHSPAQSAECEFLMASLPENKDDTATYLALVKFLTFQKNVFSPADLNELAAQENLPNPLNFVSESILPATRFAAEEAFSSLKLANWEILRGEIEKLARAKNDSAHARDEAESKTTFIYTPIYKGKIKRKMAYSIYHVVTNADGETLVIGRVGGSEPPVTVLNVTTGEEWSVGAVNYSSPLVKTNSHGVIYLRFLSARKEQMLFELEPHGKPKLIKAFPGDFAEVRAAIFFDEAGSPGTLSLARTQGKEMEASRLDPKTLEVKRYLFSDRKNSSGVAEADFYSVSPDGKPFFLDFGDQTTELRSFADPRFKVTQSRPSHFKRALNDYALWGWDRSFNIIDVFDREFVSIFNVLTGQETRISTSEPVADLYEGGEVFTGKDQTTYLLERNSKRKLLTVVDVTHKDIRNYKISGYSRSHHFYFISLKNGRNLYILAPLPSSRKEFLHIFDLTTHVTRVFPQSDFKNLGRDYGVGENPDGTVDLYFQDGRDIEVLQSMDQ